MEEKLKFVIGKNIRYYRKKMNLDQDQLGILVFKYAHTDKNAAQQKISKIETGKKEPTATELAKFAAFFKVDIKRFYDRTLEVIYTKNPRQTGGGGSSAP